VGSSAESAARAGIRTLRLRVTAYSIAGGLSAFTGLVLLGRLGAAPSEFGMGQEFFIITAVVLGGVSVYGGKGKLWRGFRGSGHRSTTAHSARWGASPQQTQLVAQP